MVNALLIVAVIALTVAFVTVARELERIRHVLHTQGLHLDTLNHVDDIQSRQLQMHREDLDRLKPLPLYQLVNLPASPADEVKGQQNGAHLPDNEQPARD